MSADDRYAAPVIQRQVVRQRERASATVEKEGVLEREKILHALFPVSTIIQGREHPS